MDCYLLHPLIAQVFKNWMCELLYYTYLLLVTSFRTDLSGPGLSDCIGYWYWVYNILVYWVFPIYVVYFVFFPIQYNTIQYYDKADLRKVKYMRERLKEMKRKRKNIPKSEGEQKK